MTIATTCSDYNKLFGDGKNLYGDLSAAGFSAVDDNEPWYAYHPTEGVYHASDEEFAAHFLAEKRRLEEAGLTAWQTHAPFPTYPEAHANLTQEETYLRMREGLKRSFTATRLLGAKYEVIHPAMRCGWGMDDDEEKTFQMNLRLFSELLPEAKKQGVTIALENMPNAWIPTATPESLIRYIDAVGDEDFVACLDTGHANITKISCGEFVRALGKRLKVLHVHDNDGKSDQHTLPFAGNIDWRDFGKALKEVGFTGAISLEAHPFYAKLPKEMGKAANVLLFAAAKKIESLIL